MTRSKNFEEYEKVKTLHNEGKRIEGFMNIMKNMSINSSLNFKTNSLVTTNLSMGGNKKVLKFLNWIYKDSTVYLTRKYDKYIKLRDMMLNKQKPLHVG